MNGKETLAAALRGRIDVPVPVAPLYLGLYFEPKRRQALAEVYRELVRGEGEAVLTVDQMLDVSIEAWARVWEPLRDRPHLMCGYWLLDRAGAEGARVVVRDGHVWWYAPGQSDPLFDYAAYYDNAHGDVWDRVDGPSTAAEVSAAVPVYPWESYLGDDSDELLRRVQARYGQDHMQYASAGSPFWVGYGLWGFAGYMETLRQRPEQEQADCQRYLDSNLQAARAMWEAGYRTYFVEECFTGSDLISPSDFAEVSWPYTRDLLAGLKDIGFQVIFYLTGGLEGRLEHLAGCAADALAFEESKKSFTIDLAAIRREIGPDKVLLGNVDVVLVRDGSEERIREEVRRQYEAAGPRYIVSIGSPLTLDTTTDKLEMLVRSARGLR